jgi:hypothetical protein
MRAMAVSYIIPIEIFAAYYVLPRKIFHTERPLCAWNSKGMFLELIEVKNPARWENVKTITQYRSNTPVAS